MTSKAPSRSTAPLLSSGEFFFVHAGVTPWMLLIEPEQHWDALGMRGNSQLPASIENYADGHSLVRTPRYSSHPHQYRPGGYANGNLTLLTTGVIVCS